jgi:carboxymethylenebutenolidase
MPDDPALRNGAYETYPSPSDGTEIRSYFAAPRTAARNPAVLMLRGVAGPDEGYNEIADRLAGVGYAALVHHWQVRGNDPDDETLIADIRAAVAFLSRRPDVDSARLAVFGYCKGGGQALIAAAALPELRLIVAFHGFARRTQGPDAAHRNPIDVADRVHRPVLLLHGEQDQLSPLPAMRDLHAALDKGGARTAMHVYPGADHGFAVSTHKGYQPQAARDSFERALAFATHHLR